MNFHLNFFILVKGVVVIFLCRKSLKNDSEILSMLQTHAKERKGRLQDSLQKVLKLRQQLKAATSIYKTNKKTFDELRSKETEVRNRVVACKKELAGSEAKILELGTQAFGEKYRNKWAKMTAAATADKVSPLRMRRSFLILGVCLHSICHRICWHKINIFLCKLTSLVSIFFLF